MNAILYGFEGDYKTAALSAGALIPIAGWGANGAKWVQKAAKAAPTLPGALKTGRNAEEGVHVHKGVRDGENVCSGITNNLSRRQAEHGDRFGIQQMSGEGGLTRGQARAVEQALILRNKGENKINAISPHQPFYNDAVAWGEHWLLKNGD